MSHFTYLKKKDNWSPGPQTDPKQRQCRGFHEGPQAYFHILARRSENNRQTFAT